jgi:hypothetical protein
MEGQSMKVSGSSVQLPDGYVTGATFYEDKGMFFVQQFARSTENDGLGNRFHRLLSSWNIESHSLITKRVTDEIPGDASIDHCGRVQISKTSHRVYVCSAESHLEIMDPDSLEAVGIMAQIDDQIITDFAVDDLNGRVLVLSVRKDGTTHLASYSLRNGEKQQEVVLPTRGTSSRGEARNDLITVSRTGQIGIYLDGQRGFIKSTPGIYMCKDTPDLSCVKASDDARTSWIPEMSFLGQDILVASSKLADNRWDCISSVAPGYKYSIMRPLAFGASSKYCSPTGVHYAVGVVEDKYVVGFTGVEYIPIYSETDKCVSSSFSVWRAGTSKVAAVVKDSTGCQSASGLLQASNRIVASKTEPLFITYNLFSNILYVYSIEDH